MNETSIDEARKIVPPISADEMVEQFAERERARERARRLDMFAAAALTGFIAWSDRSPCVSNEDIARVVWSVAETMLAAQPPAASEDGK